MKRQVKTDKGEVFIADDEKTLLELLLKNKVDIGHSCEGMGTCGTCHVFVLSPLAALPERNVVESERAADLKFAPNERLACQLPPLDNLIIRIPNP